MDYAFAFLAPTLPSLGIAIFGITLAVIRGPRHPAVSILAGVGCFLIAVPPMISLWLRLAIFREATTDESIAVFGVTGAISSVLGTVGFGLLVAAAFGWRSTSRQRSQP